MALAGRGEEKGALRCAGDSEGGKEIGRPQTANPCRKLEGADHQNFDVCGGKSPDEGMHGARPDPAGPEHIARIKRTLVASLLGILTGILSYWSGGSPNIAGLQENGFLAFMLMRAGVVVQKHIFRLLGMDTSKLGAKDWFYQGFMTFAFWFMTWTILLTSVSPALT